MPVEGDSSTVRTIVAWTFQLSVPVLGKHSLPKMFFQSPQFSYSFLSSTPPSPKLEIHYPTVIHFLGDLSAFMSEITLKIWNSSDFQEIFGVKWEHFPENLTFSNLWGVGGFWLKPVLMLRNFCLSGSLTIKEILVPTLLFCLICLLTFCVSNGRKTSWMVVVH